MRKGLNMTLEQARAHALRHGHALEVGGKVETAEKSSDAFAGIPGVWIVPKDRMNKTEREYGLILEAMERRGEIEEYRPFGIKLAWGGDPRTGKPMIYTPDFYVVVYLEEPCVPEGHKPGVEILLIEVKGPHIYEKDLIRFKGCRAEWPMFRFEMWQKKGRATGWWRVH